MMVRLICLMLILIPSVYASAIPEVKNAQKSNIGIDKKNKALADLATINRDKEILNAMDNIEDSLDLLELDRQQQLPKVMGEIDTNNEHLPIIKEELLMDDGFDDLDIDAELFEELNDIERLPKKIIPTKKGQKLPSMKSKIGVGIGGVEEQLINQLDKSDLIDIESEVELWLKPAKPFPKIMKKNDENE